MNFLELAKQRFSCRNYSDKPLDDQIILAVLEAARIAPTAVNYQPFVCIVIRKKSKLSEIHESYPRDWFKTAPAVIIICGDHAASWKRKDGKDHCDIDVAIAADHITLQATALGLATCWVCNFNRDILSTKLALPSNIEPIVMLPIGYPQENSDIERFESKRKKSAQIIFFETLNN